MSNLADNTEMNITQLSAITGDDYQERYLYYQLKLSMAKADRIDIIVSFLMESGVKLIMKDLESALERGTKIRILTGNYLGITQPSALYLLKKGLDDRIDLRFYQDRNRSFHPKSYIFHRGDHTELFIGSSNISRSALTSGIEWNYRLTSEKDRHSVDEFCRSFEDLFQKHAIVIDDAELKRYAQNWHRPAVSKDLEAFGAPEYAPGSTRCGVPGRVSGGFRHAAHRPVPGDGQADHDHRKAHRKRVPACAGSSGARTVQNGTLHPHGG
jgi:HKD family nuclease